MKQIGGAVFVGLISIILSREPLRWVDFTLGSLLAGAASVLAALAFKAY